MQLRVTKADLEGISKDYALQLKNEINKATGGKLYFTDEYPALTKLYKLLNGAFDSSVSGVHFIETRTD